MEVHVIEVNGELPARTSCPVKGPGGTSCRLEPMLTCRFGYTEVVVPEDCPLRAEGGITLEAVASRDGEIDAGG